MIPKIYFLLARKLLYFIPMKIKNQILKMEDYQHERSKNQQKTQSKKNHYCSP